MGLAVYIGAWLAGRYISMPTLAGTIQVVGGTALGVAVYTGLAFLFKSPEVAAMLNLIKKRRRA